MTHLETITDAELAEMSSTANPELSRVVEARSCLENARHNLTELAQLDPDNARALYSMHAELMSVDVEMARFERYYRDAEADADADAASVLAEQETNYLRGLGGRR